jgi:hypothetical protein
MCFTASAIPAQNIFQPDTYSASYVWSALNRHAEMHVGPHQESIISLTLTKMFQQSSQKLSDIKVRENPLSNFQLLQVKGESRDSAVGIATGYGLDDGGVGVWVPVG